MGERASVEITAQFAVDAVEHIQIEARGDAGCIVVSLVQHAYVLFEVYADHHLRVSSENVARAAQEAAGFMRLEISKRRSREKAHLRHRGDGVGKRKRRGEIRRERVDVERWKILAQGNGLGFEEVAGNVHGNVGAKRALLQQQP